MIYDTYCYLWPPRPEKSIPRDMIPFYESRGYLAQVKKNGTCTVVFAQGKTVVWKTRHKEDHKLWTPLAAHNKFFHGRSAKWNVYVAELLHRGKTPGGIEHQLYLFDQLVVNGTMLVGVTYAERQALLQKNMQVNGKGARDHWRVDPHFMVAKNITSDFDVVWNGLGKEDEGLVFKKPDAPLKLCLRATANAGWQVKVRRPTKNYGF